MFLELAEKFTLHDKWLCYIKVMRGEIKMDIGLPIILIIGFIAAFLSGKLIKHAYDPSEIETSKTNETP